MMLRVAAAFFVFASRAALAQGDAPVPDLAGADSAIVQYRSPASPLAFTAWGGQAHNSPGIWGAETGRDVSVVALRIAQPLAHNAHVELDYVMDLVPAAWVSMPDVRRVLRSCNVPKPGSQCAVDIAADGGAARGFGVAPLGFQLRFRPAARVQPYFTMGAGVLRFERETPIVEAAKLNFTADAGAGVLVMLRRGLGVMAGYKFYHISNAGTADQNPGIDAHMMVLGLRRSGR